jgi:hypothetical protein
MIPKFKKYSMLVAAAATVVSVSNAANAAVITTVTETGANQTFSNGSYDVYDVVLTGLTAPDNVAGPLGQAPAVLQVAGTFTDVSGFAMIGDNSAGSKGYYQKFITGATSITGYSTTTTGFDSLSGVTRVSTDGASNGTTSKAPTTAAGTATSFGGSFSTSDANIEPAGSPDVVAGNNGDLLFEVLVAPGSSWTFVGSPTTYGSNQTEVLTFGSGGGTTSPPPTHSIVSLGSSAPTGYGNTLTTITVTHVSGGAVMAGYDYLTNTTTAMATAVQPVTGFSATDTPQEFALALLVGGVAPTSTQLATIIADINSASSTDGVVASLVPSNFGGVFPASKGFDLMLTSTTTDATPNLGFDFSAETNVAGVTVTAVAAVPEPATAVGLLVGAGSLLLGRRKNRVA